MVPLYFLPHFQKIVLYHNYTISYTLDSLKRDSLKRALRDTTEGTQLKGTGAVLLIQRAVDRSTTSPLYN